MLILKKTIFILFKVIVSFIFIILIAYYNGILLVLKEDFGFQLTLYRFLSFLLVILFIIYPFINKKIFNKTLWMLFFLWFFSMRLPGIQFYFASDNCLDTGTCKEGLEVNTEYGLVRINKENCTKYNWEWLDKIKTCEIKNNS